MCTITLSYDENNTLAQQQLAALLASGLFMQLNQKQNGQDRVYIENGEVKMELQSDTLTIEESKDLTMRMVELEYALP